MDFTWQLNIFAVGVVCNLFLCFTSTPLPPPQFHRHGSHKRALSLIYFISVCICVLQTSTYALLTCKTSIHAKMAYMGQQIIGIKFATKTHIKKKKPIGFSTRSFWSDSRRRCRRWWRHLTLGWTVQSAVGNEEWLVFENIHPRSCLPAYWK